MRRRTSHEKESMMLGVSEGAPRGGKCGSKVGVIFEQGLKDVRNVRFSTDLAGFRCPLLPSADQT
jgi:hypothetical protein